MSAHNNATEVSDFRAWSEEPLIVAAKNGRRAPFGELCERHMKKLFYITRRITRNREDAVQDSLLNAFVHVEDFDERSRFVSWLTRIAINAALVKLRKKRGNREIAIEQPKPSPGLEAHLEIPDDAPDPEVTYHLRERKQVVNVALSGLRAQVRKAVEAHKLLEYSLKETAQILRTSTAAAKARMLHARAALHRMSLLQSFARSNRLSAR